MLTTLAPLPLLTGAHFWSYSSAVLKTPVLRGVAPERTSDIDVVPVVLGGASESTENWSSS